MDGKPGPGEVELLLLLSQVEVGRCRLYKPRQAGATLNWLLSLLTPEPRVEFYG